MRVISEKESTIVRAYLCLEVGGEEKKAAASRVMERVAADGEVGTGR